MPTGYNNHTTYQEESTLRSTVRIMVNITVCIAVAWVIFTLFGHLYDPSIGLTGNALRALANGAMLTATALIVNYTISEIVPLPRPLQVIAEFSAEHADALLITIGILYLIGSIGFDIYHGESLLHVYVPSVR